MKLPHKADSHLKSPLGSSSSSTTHAYKFCNIRESKRHLYLVMLDYTKIFIEFKFHGTQTFQFEKHKTEFGLGSELEIKT